MPRLGTLVALTVSRLAFGYQLQTVASLSPDLIASFGIGFAGLGTLMGIYLLPGAAAALPYGIVASRIGDRPIIIFGLLVMTAGSLVCAVAAGPAMLGAGRLIAGAGAVSITVLQSKIVADRFEGAAFINAMGLSVGAFPVGIGIAQLAQPRLSHLFGWPAGFVSGALFSLVGLLLFLATWHEPPAARARSFVWPSRHECKLVAIAALIWTAYNAGYFNFLAFMPIYLSAHGHPAWEADVVLTAATWSTLPAILLGGTVGTRFGQGRVFLFGAVLNTVAVSGLFFADLPLLFGLLFGTFASVHAAIMVALGTLSTRPQNRAVGMAMFYAIYYAGGFFVPPLCGRAAEWAGDPSGAFLCAGLLAALSIPLFYYHRHVAAGTP